MDVDMLWMVDGGAVALFMCKDILEEYLRQCFFLHGSWIESNFEVLDESSTS